MGSEARAKHLARFGTCTHVQRAVWLYAYVCGARRVRVGICTCARSITGVVVDLRKRERGSERENV